MTSREMTIHFIEKRGSPRLQCVQWAAIGRLPWREAESASFVATG